jgi:hypothetical protein
MKEYKNIAEWLEARGNPKHAIADGDDGMKILVVEREDSISPCACIYKYSDDKGYFYMSSGWGVNQEYFTALKKFLNGEES